MNISEHELRLWVSQDVTQGLLRYIKDNIEEYTEAWLLGKDPSQQYVAALNDVYCDIKNGTFATIEPEEK